MSTLYRNTNSHHPKQQQQLGLLQINDTDGTSERGSPRPTERPISPIVRHIGTSTTSPRQRRSYDNLKRDCCNRDNNNGTELDGTSSPNSSCDTADDDKEEKLKSNKEIFRHRINTFRIKFIMPFLRVYLLVFSNKQGLLKIILLSIFMVTLLNLPSSLEYEHIGQTLSTKSLPSHPRTMAIYFTPPNTYIQKHKIDIIKVQRLATYRDDIYPSKRKIPEWTVDNDVSSTLSSAKKQLKNSKKYNRGRAENMERPGCALHQWQKSTSVHSTCNLVHELDVLNFISIVKSNPNKEKDMVVHDNKSSSSSSPPFSIQENVRLLASGYWRDVWKIRATSTMEINNNNDDAQLSMKTVRYKHAFNDRNYDRHKRDALAAERFQSSPNVMDIYGFCGQTAINEFAHLGSMTDYLWPEPTDEIAEGDDVLTTDQNAGKEEHDGMDNPDNDEVDDAMYPDCEWTMPQRLVAAYQVARAISDFHNIDETGVSFIAHTDITPSQFMLIDGSFKLNDFNRCRFIPYNTTNTKSACTYRVAKNPGRYRAPEEYAYEEQSEKVDIYSMGNIFYSLLTEYWPFEDVEEEDAHELVMKGRRPTLEGLIVRKSTDETSNEDKLKEAMSIVALKKVMKMCWKQEPSSRPSAKKVALQLKKHMQKIDPSLLTYKFS